MNSSPLSPYLPAPRAASGFSRLMRSMASLAAAGLFAGAAASSALAIQTDNQGLHAVPVPRQVAVDGDLADWDLSGQVLMCYDVEALIDVHSAKVAAMYDADNLYVSIHWKDKTPLGNSHDPLYQAAKGWAGDCVQLRIKSADRMSHITAWYYGPKDEPAMDITYGIGLQKPFGGERMMILRKDGWKMDQGVEMAFKKDADGGGYVQEIKLPWKLVSTKAQYAAGDKLQMGVELLWGEADWPVHRYADNVLEGASGREFFFTNHPAWGNLFLEPKGNLKLPVPQWQKELAGEQASGPVDIAYELAKDSRVTLAIDDAKGNRIRNLVAAANRKAGKNVEKWDGLDDNGLPAAPGQYTFRAISHDGIKLNYVMMFGSPGNPGWDNGTGTGAFYGDHMPPMASAAAGKFVALGCPMGEAGKHLIGVDLNGQRVWGLPNRQAFDGGEMVLATDGTTLWVGNNGNDVTIYRVTLAKGKYSPWKRKAKDAEGRDYEVLDLPVGSLPGRVPDESDPKKQKTKRAPFNMSALALGKDGLAVALKRENKIQILDPETGDIRREIAVTEPVAMVYGKDDNLVVLTEGKLVKLDADGKQTPFTPAAANATYPDGYGLAVDADGNIYLSDRGADMNVKVFSPGGELVKEIGQKGGRTTNGPYNADAMQKPGRISVDSTGKLWVPEATTNPKRTSVWDTTTGKLVKDLVGTTGYAGSGSINPADPTMAFSENTVFRINLATGEWKPVYSVGKTRHHDEIFKAVVGSRVQIINRDGTIYVYSGDHTVTVCTMLRDGKWVPAAAFGKVAKKVQNEHGTNFDHPLLDEHEDEMFSWADKNGDALVQADELLFSPEKFQTGYWGIRPGLDGSLAMLRTVLPPKVDKKAAAPAKAKDKEAAAAGTPPPAPEPAPAKKGPELLRIPVASYTACGAPVWDITKPEIVEIQDKDLKITNTAMTRGGSDSVVYINANPLLAMDSKTGKILGRYPSNVVSVHGSHKAASSRPGYLIGPNSIIGTIDMGQGIGEVFSMNGNLGEHFLFTRDGLWIQSLFKDTRGSFEVPEQAVRGMSMDATTAGGESFGGYFFRAPDGKVYVVIGGTDARVLEVSGLDKIKRFDGTFTYTAQQYADAQAQALAKASEATKAKSYTVAKTAAPLPALDPKSKDKEIPAWPELTAEGDAVPANVAAIEDGPTKRFGRAAARWDDQNLYVAWRVNNGARPRNAGQDWRLFFKTGDVVDIMIGAEDEKAAKKGEGTRVVIAFAGDKQEPQAVVNQKFATGGAPRKEEAFEFTSPWRSIAFQRVAQAPEVAVSMRKLGGGYVIQAAIPWKLLGLTPRPGMKLRGDFGILGADAAGINTVSRNYWSNKNTNLVNDIPGEGDITPMLWGTWTLE